MIQLVVPGEITEIVGRRSAGRTSVLVACLAAVTRTGGVAPPRLPLTVAFRLRLAARRSEAALLIVAPRRIAGAAASLAVETRRQGTSWEGTPVPARLDGARIGLKVIRSRQGQEREPPEPWELRA